MATPHLLRSHDLELSDVALVHFADEFVGEVGLNDGCDLGDVGFLDGSEFGLILFNELPEKDIVLEFNFVKALDDVVLDFLGWFGLFDWFGVSGEQDGLEGVLLEDLETFEPFAIVNHIYYIIYDR